MQVKKSLEESEKAGGREANKKNVVHKAVFDELVALVDPGTEPYKPLKGKTNVLMAVGIQVRFWSIFYNGGALMNSLHVGCR